jgi:hypothetical protein
MRMSKHIGHIPYPCNAFFNCSYENVQSCWPHSLSLQCLLQLLIRECPNMLATFLCLQCLQIAHTRMSKHIGHVLYACNEAPLPCAAHHSVGFVPVHSLANYVPGPSHSWPVSFVAGSVPAISPAGYVLVSPLRVLKQHHLRSSMPTPLNGAPLLNGRTSLWALSPYSVLLPLSTCSSPAPFQTSMVYRFSPTYMLHSRSYSQSASTALLPTGPVVVVSFTDSRFSSARPATFVISGFFRSPPVGPVSLHLFDASSFHVLLIYG